MGKVNNFANQNSLRLSRNCLFDHIDSYECYELTKKCSFLHLMLASPLTNVLICTLQMFNETELAMDYYHPSIRVGNVFGHVCVSVCLSVCLSVQAITFELLDIETSFLVCRYILTISRSCLSINIIGSRSRSYEKNDSFTYFNFLILCMWPQVINKVKVTHQSEGHIKIKVKISSSLPILCINLLILTC